MEHFSTFTAFYICLRFSFNDKPDAQKPERLRFRTNQVSNIATTIQNPLSCPKLDAKIPLTDADDEELPKRLLIHKSWQDFQTDWPRLID